LLVGYTVLSKLLFLEFTNNVWYPKQKQILDCKNGVLPSKVGSIVQATYMVSTKTDIKLRRRNTIITVINQTNW